MPIKPETETPAPADPLATQDVTLTEFCTRLSSTDRRVEMIAGFESSERRAGRVKDSGVGFAARYAVFITQPV